MIELSYILPSDDRWPREAREGNRSASHPPYYSGGFSPNGMDDTWIAQVIK